jgi:hypothetical protein
MTPVDLARTIGDILTNIDIVLQAPDLKDPDWQILYALRKHLDDQQRDLIQQTFQTGNAQYQALTEQIKRASTDLEDLIERLDRISAIIKRIAEVAAIIDKLISMVPKM